MGQAKRRQEREERARAQRGPRRDLFDRARRATVAFGTLSDKEEFRILGSGVIVDRSGIVLTARHVIDAAEFEAMKARRIGVNVVPGIFLLSEATYQYATQEDKHEVSFGYQMLRPIVMNFHRKHDLAVAKVEPTPDLPCLPVDYEADPREGDEIATCGFPYGAELHGGATVLSSFLTGMVSAVVPHPAMPPTGRQHYVLQLPVNPGNSGGPVFDPDTGHVLGIVSRRYQPGGIPSGLSVAEPIHEARGLIERARAHKE